MLFVSSFRNLIASLLGDALDAGSSCSFGFALTRPFGCGSFARPKSLCSTFLFCFVVYSTLHWYCSLPSVTHYPCITSLCWCSTSHGYMDVAPPPRSPRSSPVWTARVSVNIVYLKASIPYCWTCSLWPKYSFLVSLLLTPNLSNHWAWSRLHPLLCTISKVSSSIWMLVFCRYSRI